MRLFGHIVDRVLIHVYVWAALVMAYAYLDDTIQFRDAAIKVAVAQANALTVLALKLAGT